jgi:uncharacterized protein (DUF362 family)
MSQSDHKDSEVAIVREESPEKGLKEGIGQLGGISNFIQEEDTVFIKINLSIPQGFPVHTNLDTLKALIKECKDAGASKVLVGSYTYENIPINIVADFIGLKSFCDGLGAEFIVLDNSDLYIDKKISRQDLVEKKFSIMTKVEVSEGEIEIPEGILKADKMIILNQVNVHPLFDFTLSLLSSYSMVPNSYQKIKNISSNNNTNSTEESQDSYKKKLTSRIIDIFSVRKPDLVINDLFYLMEKAGPFIFKDSNLKKTNLIVLGHDAVSVDAITMRAMDYNLFKNDLMVRAREKELGPAKLSDIKIKGEDIENIKLQVNLCPSKLEDIDLLNTSINSGSVCSACFNQAFHLLNFIKTNLTKDLKYLKRFQFLTGKDPDNPKDLEHIVLFGDCAIKSTREADFRKIKTESFLFKKEKEKENPSILELKGCPPEPFECLSSIFDFFGKGKMPDLNFHLKEISTYYNQDFKEKLDLWEEI